ncbi:MAG: hypothetical protein Ct9H90mP5_04790 [Acidimicrobiaceae bacterium]|nr:MAG: hypothetical protein Ct9H90mP5_04790 [Acidimicrobiaceae bacterium]
MMSATSSMSSQDIPMLVNAGVPNLIPDVYQAPFGSKGMEFRFTITPASSKGAFSLSSGEAETPNIDEY